MARLGELLQEHAKQRMAIKLTHAEMLQAHELAASVERLGSSMLRMAARSLTINIPHKSTYFLFEQGQDLPFTFNYDRGGFEWLAARWLGEPFDWQPFMLVPGAESGKELEVGQFSFLFLGGHQVSQPGLIPVAKWSAKLPSALEGSLARWLSERGYKVEMVENEVSGMQVSW
jgi:hypothetical protein